MTMTWFVSSLALRLRRAGIPMTMARCSPVMPALSKTRRGSFLLHLLGNPLIVSVALAAMNHSVDELSELTSSPPESPLKLPPSSADEAGARISPNHGRCALPNVQAYDCVVQTDNVVVQTDNIVVQADDYVVQTDNVVVQTDNFVGPQRASSTLESEFNGLTDSSPAASHHGVAAVVASHAADGDCSVDPDETSTTIHNSTRTPECTVEDAAEIEHRRLQLLREVRDRACLIQTVLDSERESQHVTMLLALEKRKIAKAGSAHLSSDADEGAILSCSSGNLGDANHQACSTSDAASETNLMKNPSSTIPVAASDLASDAADSAHHSSSRASSPVSSSRLRRSCPDIRIEVATQDPVGKVDSESARDGSLSDHWMMRQQNVDSLIHAQLTEMGFESRIAIVALERTGSTSLQEAVDFCLDHGSEDLADAVSFDGDSDHSTGDISLHGGRSNSDDDDSSYMGGGRMAAGNDMQQESQLLRLFVELLRGSEGPHTVSGRGIFAEGSALANIRPNSAARLAFASTTFQAPARRLGVLEQLHQIASQGQLDRIAPLVRSHSGPSRMLQFVGQGATSGANPLHQQQQLPAENSSEGPAAMAGVMQADFVECSYCYDMVPKQEIKTMTCCLFTCCSSCMSRDFTVRINDGNTLIRCHHCGNSVSTAFIRESVSNQTFSKFLRFQAARENPLLRSCSKCGHVQEGKSSKPSMTCVGCNYVYCFVHGDAHPGQSCADWVRNHAAVEKATASVIKKDSKKCPQCRVVTYKTDGCNHMHCSRCACDWCWICASKFDAQGRAYPLHYKWWNFFGCGGMQFNTCWGVSLPALYLKRFFTFLFVITAGPLSLALGACAVAVYLALLFPIMIPAYMWGRKHYASWAYTWSEFFQASFKKMLQVLGILIIAPPALALAIALFPLTLFVMRRALWRDDD